MRRRSVLCLLGLGGVGALTAKGLSGCRLQLGKSSALQSFPFQPVRVPLPVNSDGLQASEQQSTYRELVVEDRLTVPDGFESQLLAAWGDSLGISRFGFNNDHLGFVQQGPDRASMTVNFEYISAVPWVQGFAEVVGRPLPYAALVASLQASDGVMDCTALPAGDRRLQQIRAVADEAMTDLGIGVMTLQRDGQGHWRRARGSQDRRITGISGLDDPQQQLLSTGPAAAVFRASLRQGYDDGLGDRIIGTFANCGGGTTPWGTVLSAEENFQSQVPEPVHADGSAVAPTERPFVCKDGKLGGLGNVYGLAGNKYGWMVEWIRPRRTDCGDTRPWAVSAMKRWRCEPNPASRCRCIQAVTAAAGTSIGLSVLRASKRSPTSAIHGCLRPVSCRWRASMPMAVVNGWR